MSAVTLIAADVAVASIPNVVTRGYIGGMKAVGVRELKAQLSRYLRDVQAGETVLVTDRGRVIAELRAPGSAAPAAETDLERRLRRLAERVPLRIGEPQDRSIYLNKPRLSQPMPAGTAQRLLDEEREDRV